MRIAEMNWMQVEERAAKDDRCILPLGSVEQHAYLSLAVDMILAERVSVDAAEPSGVPVFPVMPYGLASSFADYPGTVSLRLSTYAALVEDMLDSLHRSGFRRILIVNGHGGNTPVTALVSEWLNAHRDTMVKFHDWCARQKSGPRCRPPTRPPRTPRGWRIFPGRGSPASPCRRRANRRSTMQGLPASTPGASGRCSATAITTGSTSARTRT